MYSAHPPCFFSIATEQSCSGLILLTKWMPGWTGSFRINGKTEALPNQVFRRITCLVCYTISLQLIFRYKQHQSFTLHTSEPSTFHKLTALFVFQVLALRSCGRTQTQNCFCHFGAKQLSLVQINDYALKNICN